MRQEIIQEETIQGFRLTPQQKRLWLLQQAGSARSYRAECKVYIEGRLDRHALRVALKKVVDGHDVFNMAFRRLPGMAAPLQVPVRAELQWIEDHSLAEVCLESGVDQIEEQLEKHDRADNEVGEPQNAFRAALFVLAPDRHLLVLSLSALCADARTLKNVVRELCAAYAGKSADRDDASEVLQYTVLSEWLNELLESEDTRAGREYWQSQNFSALSTFKLPFDNDNASSEFAPSFLSVDFGHDLAPRLEVIAEGNGVTLSTLLQACWRILLHRVSGQDTVITGGEFDGRADAELQTVMGLLARYLPICSEIIGDTRFSEVLRQAQESVDQAATWQDCFTWGLIDQSAGDEPGPLFFRYVFEYGEEEPTVQAADLRFTIHRLSACIDRFNLKVSCIRRAHFLKAEFHYDRNVIPAEFVARLAGQFQALVTSALVNPDGKIGELELLGDRERRQILVDFNRAQSGYNAWVCISQMVEEQVRRTPDRVAVEFNQHQLTYSELNARANQLGRHLQDLGVGPERLVAICQDRSLEMVVGLLAILKAGAAYLPIDPSLPFGRAIYMLNDAKPAALLTSSAEAVRFKEHVSQIVSLDGESQSGGELNRENPVSNVVPANLAYVIYTSGSTGKPKGVMITHHGICNRLLWMQETYPIGETDHVLQKTTFTFDASVWEYFVPMMSGARLVMALPEGHQDSAYLVNAVIDHEVTILQLVPSMLQIILSEPGVENCKSLRRVFCGGEAFPSQLQSRFYAKLNAELYNLYGPTEVSIDASSWPCDPAFHPVNRAVIPIGRPIGNTRIYLLDESLNPVPGGFPGELHVSGAGLARAYLNRPDLTAEKFIPDPFGDEPDARMYKTGDLARLLPDGVIEYLGRSDNQVKLRGFRIELGEIESALREHSAIAEVVVVDREDETGGKSLIAYLVEQPHSLSSSGHQLYQLPNRMKVAHLNKSETDHLYKEIFEDEGYLKRGITLADGDCVFDIGANIGLFTLFVNDRWRNLQVFAFEPIPTTFAALDANISLYELNVNRQQCGISDRTGHARFTFYPKVSASSGMYADSREDEQVTRAFINNQSETFRDFADELMEGRFNSVIFECPIKTLSQVIRENGVEQIDLLKIDVEKSELDVLRGIEEGDWRKIKQLVMEVHDIGGRLEQIRQLLADHGYEVQYGRLDFFEQTGLYNLYAIHKTKLNGAGDKSNGAPKDGRLARTLDRSIAPTELRQFLKQRLPDYMLPSAFVTLPALPRASSGKIDRRALNDLERPTAISLGKQKKPRTLVEEILVEIWKGVLGVEEVGIDDNFFDLGGHSLLATRVISRLRGYFQVEVPLRLLFEAPTPAGLASHLEAALSGAGRQSAPPITARSRGGALELSYAQERLWFIDQMTPGNNYYNIAAAIRMEGELNVRALERTLSEVVRRHEALRTTFAVVGGRPTQVIGEAVGIAIEVEDLSGEAEAESAVRERVQEEAGRGFDLSRGPLLRMRLLRLGEEAHVAVVVMHHIVSDEWSLGVLVREVCELYASYSRGEEPELGELAAQYADYAAWQREWLRGETLAKEKEYWRERLSGMKRLELASDYERPVAPSYRGGREEFEVREEVVKRLREVGRERGATLYMALLAGFKVLMYRWSGEEDLSVGMPIANRNREEVEGLIGFFVNLLVMRVRVEGERRYEEIVERVREAAIGGYGHQDLPFEKVVEEVGPSREMNRMPLVEVVFSFENAPQSHMLLPGLTLTAAPINQEAVKFDLILSMRESEGKLNGCLQYRIDLFAGATIRRMADHFQAILAAVAQNPQLRVIDIPLDEKTPIADPVSLLDVADDVADAGEQFVF